MRAAPHQPEVNSLVPLFVCRNSKCATYIIFKFHCYQKKRREKKDDDDDDDDDDDQKKKKYVQTKEKEKSEGIQAAHLRAVGIGAEGVLLGVS